MAIPDENGAIKTPAVLTLGFTTANLVDELAIGIIIIGLGSSDDQYQLKHTLTHKGVSTLDAILTKLQKADNLVCSDGIAVESTPLTSAGTLAAKGKKASFNCLLHVKNMTHNTKDCRAQQQDKPKAKPVTKHAHAADNGNESSDSAQITQAAKLASFPHHQRTSTSTDTTWNTDSGATVHMTPH